MEYTDYELLQILDENNYEASVKNLEILKEGLENGDIELLDEYTFSTGFEERWRQEKREQTKKDFVTSRRGAKKDGQNAARLISMARKEKADGTDPEYHEYLTNMVKDNIEGGKKYKRNANEKLAGLIVTTESIISDYELLQILEENEYEPSLENLEILKEGLENGDYELEDEDILDESIRLQNASNRGNIRKQYRKKIKKVKHDAKEKKKALENQYGRNDISDRQFEDRTKDIADGSKADISRLKQQRTDAIKKSNENAATAISYRKATRKLTKGLANGDSNGIASSAASVGFGKRRVKVSTDASYKNIGGRTTIEGTSGKMERKEKESKDSSGK